jgi:hypothetical protein
MFADHFACGAELFLATVAPFAMTASGHVVNAHAVARLKASTPLLHHAADFVAGGERERFDP